MARFEISPCQLHANIRRNMRSTMDTLGKEVNTNKFIFWYYFSQEREFINQIVDLVIHVLSYCPNIVINDDGPKAKVLHLKPRTFSNKVLPSFKLKLTKLITPRVINQPLKPVTVTKQSRVESTTCSAS